MSPAGEEAELAEGSSDPPFGGEVGETGEKRDEETIENFGSPEAKKDLTFSMSVFKILCKASRVKNAMCGVATTFG